jgi:hypothetical protein
VIKMLNRRKVVAGGSALLAAPYFFFSSKVYAVDQLTAGLIKEASLVTDHLSMRPAGAQDGTDRQVVGGGVLLGRTVREQADMMTKDNFTDIETSERVTREVHSNGMGFMFARFSASRHNICCPFGVISNQSGGPYAGAMTLLEGPNLVAFRGITEILVQRGYSATQIHDLCWPISGSPVAMRMRALINFGRILKVPGSDEWADRDVLTARAAQCVLRYSHIGGVPDGGGEAALIRNGETELRLAFKYDLAVLRS